MFRPLYENIHTVCWIFSSLLFLCVLIYFLVGAIIKRYGISFKLLLIGEEYMFALLSSVVIFLTLSFPIALATWFIVFFLMSYIFRDNQRIISYFAHCELNKNMLNRRQLRLYSQSNSNLSSTRITLWIKDFYCLRRRTLYNLNSDIHTNHSKHKCKILPFSLFASGTIGISVSLLTYGCLVENSSLFLMNVLENYAILSCVLVVLYMLLYFALVGNIYHYMYGHKRLFKIMFGVFSIIMYVGVTVISMNT